jgi:hypothetical protein
MRDECNAKFVETTMTNKLDNRTIAAKIDMENYKLHAKINHLDIQKKSKIES